MNNKLSAIFVGVALAAAAPIFAQNQSAEAIDSSKTRTVKTDPNSIIDERAVRRMSISDAERLSYHTVVPGRETKGMLVAHLSVPPHLIEKAEEEARNIHELYENEETPYNTEMVVGFDVNPVVKDEILVCFYMDGNICKMGDDNVQFFTLDEVKEHNQFFLKKNIIQAKGDYAPATNSTPEDPVIGGRTFSID